MKNNKGMFIKTNKGVMLLAIFLVLLVSSSTIMEGVDGSKIQRRELLVFDLPPGVFEAALKASAAKITEKGIEKWFGARAAEGFRRGKYYYNKLKKLNDAYEIYKAYKNQADDKLQGYCSQWCAQNCYDACGDKECSINDRVSSSCNTSDSDTPSSGNPSSSPPAADRNFDLVQSNGKKDGAIIVAFMFLVLQAILLV